MALPLSTLLSQALVAFTIEFDNAFEQRMPNVTVVGGATNAAAGVAEWGYAPWLASQAMYANFLRFVGEAGAPAGEVQRLARVPPQAMQVGVAGMSRWGYVRVAPDPADRRPKPPRGDWIIRPTAAGRRALREWAPLAGEIESRWMARFGDQEIAELRSRLRELTGRIGRAMPDYLPIVGWGMHAKTPEAELNSRADADDLSALLAKALLAFTLDYETQPGVSLMIAANLLRVLSASGQPVRDLPRLTGVSKQAVSMALTVLKRAGLVIVGADITRARTKLAGLTAEGQAAKVAYERRLKDVEAAWRERYGPETLDRLRGVLEAIVGGPGLDASPLAKGLEPPPTGWRARMTRPKTLPHHPMVLHRGGYPDGS